MVQQPGEANTGGPYQRSEIRERKKKHLELRAETIIMCMKAKTSATRKQVVSHQSGFGCVLKIYKYILFNRLFIQPKTWSISC
jgi:hypothetical protein